MGTFFELIGWESFRSAAAIAEPKHKTSLVDLKCDHCTASEEKHRTRRLCNGSSSTAKENQYTNCNVLEIDRTQADLKSWATPSLLQATQKSQEPLGAVLLHEDCRDSGFSCRTAICTLFRLFRFLHAIYLTASIHLHIHPPWSTHGRGKLIRARSNAGSGWLGRALARLLHQPSTAGWLAQTAHRPKQSRPTHWLGSSGPGGTFYTTIRGCLSHKLQQEGLCRVWASNSGWDESFYFLSCLCYCFFSWDVLFEAQWTLGEHGFWLRWVHFGFDFWIAISRGRCSST